MPDQPLPYRDASLPSDQRVADLLARMTLQEKIGQTCQAFVTPEARDQVADRIRRGEIGSLILAASNLAGSDHRYFVAVAELNELQRLALAESRLGIPLIHGRDIIHGHRTVFPIPLALAASWDPALVAEAFAVAAREAASAGVHWSFAPMLDIARDPRWGRVIEGFGEDPYLAAKMAATAVRGFQGEDPAETGPDGERRRLLACAKHYVGYGGAEGGRDYNTAEISDHTLREIYLPPFEAAVAAGVGSVMSAFHDLNGEAASGSHYLLSEVLKGELGFAGFIVSDWASVAELINHRVAADEREAGRLAFQAGVDMEMVSTCYTHHLEGLVESGEISPARLDDACRRILAAKFRLGLFERPYVDPALGEKVQFCAEHQDLARRVAGRCLVLLQNNGGLLPLSKDLRSMAVIGPLAEQRRALLGSWVMDGLASETHTLLEALQAACPQAEIRTAPAALSDEMLIAAAEAEVVILAVGESHARNGEYNSVASIELPAGQEALIEAVSALGKPVVLVVLSGRPLSLGRAGRFVDAILWAWHPGSLGAAAIAEVIFGDVNPGGKLPLTFPRTEGQIPIHYNHKSTGRPSMARYLDLPVRPLYPFGFGLSYTTFAYGDLQVSPAEIKVSETVTVSALVTNTGQRPGEEVVQCYLQDCVASLTRPVCELKGFARVALQPGESRRVSFTLGSAETGFTGRDGRRRVEPGDFKVWIGGDSQADLEAGFTVI